MGDSEELLREALRVVIREKELKWKVLFARTRPTPRFQNHVESTLNLFRDRADYGSLSSEALVRNFQEPETNLKEHWKTVFGDMHTTTTLLLNMNSIELFLLSKLKEDYTNNSPYVVTPALLSLARCKGDVADRKQAAKTANINVDDLDQNYLVDLAIKELTFDRVHVEKKLRAAALRNGQPGSDIQSLIDHCEWAGLAEASVKDRILADQILASQSHFCSKREHADVLTGLKKMQNKYFDKIVDSSQFVISAHASTLSAKAASADEKESGRSSPPRYHDLVPADDCIPAKTIKAHIRSYLGRSLMWLPKTKPEARNSNAISSQSSGKACAP